MNIRDNGFQLTLPLQLRKAQMAAVGLDPVDDELFPVEAIVLLGIALKEGMA